MARSLNVAPFRLFLRRVEGQILRTSKRYVDNRAEKIRAEIARMNSDFWSTFITMAIDVPGAPNLNEFTPRWKPLAPSYAKRKLKGGHGFYYNTGALKRSLSQARSSLLGAPSITFTKIPSRVARNESFRFEIDPAPRLSGLRGEKLLRAINGPTGQRAMKLSNFRGQTNRPIFEPYLKWWVKYVITPRVVRSLK